MSLMSRSRSPPSPRSVTARFDARLRASALQRRPRSAGQRGDAARAQEARRAGRLDDGRHACSATSPSAGRARGALHELRTRRRGATVGRCHRVQQQLMALAPPADRAARPPGCRWILRARRLELARGEAPGHRHFKVRCGRTRVHAGVVALAMPMRRVAIPARPCARGARVETHRRCAAGAASSARTGAEPAEPLIALYRSAPARRPMILPSPPPSACLLRAEMLDEAAESVREARSRARRSARRSRVPRRRVRARGETASGRGISGALRLRYTRSMAAPRTDCAPSRRVAGSVRACRRWTRSPQQTR